MNARRAATSVRAILLCTGLLLIGSSVEAQDVPRVRLVATGGTISNAEGGRLTHQDLLAGLPQLGRYVRAESEQFSNVASGDLTLTQWLQLARRVNEIFASDRDLAGIVVTAGTDTLEEIAYFLNLTVRDARPVVLVGAMRRPGAAGADGVANLLDGFRVAADLGSRNKGVLVVLNDEINAAREVTKIDARRPDAFQTRGYGVLGVVDADRVVYYRDVLRRHTAGSEFDVSAIEALPRIDVLMVYQGASGDLIRAAVDAGAKGIVIATAGAGATSGTQRDAIAYAAGKEVFVVSSTRTGAGRIPTQQREPGPVEGERRDYPGLTDVARRYMVGAEDLAPVKARILLMLALTRTQDPSEVARMFVEY